MEDYRIMFNKIIEEHVAIRGNVKLVGDSVNDQEALKNIRKSQPERRPDQTEVLSEKQRGLQQTLSFLEQGLSNHFALESRYLPSFVGELLMRALLFEHHRIQDQINEAKLMAFDMKLDGLNKEELLSRDIQIQKIINGLSQAIEEHSAKEEILLEMLTRGMKESGRMTP